MKPLMILALLMLSLHAPLPAAEPEPGNSPGRYQFFVVPPAKEGGKPVVFRFDTQTGRAWRFDPGSKVLVQPDDVNGSKYPSWMTTEQMKEQVRQMLKEGTPLLETPAWEELDEKAKGFRAWEGEPLKEPLLPLVRDGK